MVWAKTLKHGWHFDLDLFSWWSCYGLHHGIHQHDTTNHLGSYLLELFPNLHRRVANPSYTLESSSLKKRSWESKVAGLNPKNMFGNVRRHRWYRKWILNMGEFPGFGGLIRGQIYNPGITAGCFFFLINFNETHEPHFNGGPRGKIQQSRRPDVGVFLFLLKHPIEELCASQSGNQIPLPVIVLMKMPTRNSYILFLKHHGNQW